MKHRTREVSVEALRLVLGTVLCLQAAAVLLHGELAGPLHVPAAVLLSIGWCEVLAAVLLLIPWTAFAGAGALLVVLLPTAVLHAILGQRFGSLLIDAAAAGVILAHRWPKRAGTVVEDAHGRR